MLLGGGIALLQLGASLLGLDQDGLDSELHGTQLSEGLQFLSVRTMSAGVAFFGLGGIAGMRVGLPGVLAAAIGIVSGAAAATGVSFIMRAMRRLESDRTLRLEDAIGQTGDVYLSIPAARGGLGKVHITAKQRFTEIDAMTPGDELATGTRVLVIDAVPPSTVIVVPQPRLLDDGEENA